MNLELWNSHRVALDRRCTTPSTFSIVAWDARNGDLGVAVESKFIAVGALVPWARAKVGAIATQAWANVSYGPTGLNNEGFISDVEGVLARTERVLRFLASSLLGRKKQRAEALLRKVARAREGRLRFTLELKDPLGNSTIVSEKAKKRRLSARELNRLKFGEHAIAARRRS